MEGFDPKGLAWKTDCSELVAISKGDPHEINGFFTDPPATIEILIPSFGTNIDKISLPIMWVVVSLYINSFCSDFF